MFTQPELFFLKLHPTEASGSFAFSTGPYINLTKIESFVVSGCTNVWDGHLHLWKKTEITGEIFHSHKVHRIICCKKLNSDDSGMFVITTHFWLRQLYSLDVHSPFIPVHPRARERKINPIPWFKTLQTIKSLSRHLSDFTVLHIS